MQIFPVWRGYLPEVYSGSADIKEQVIKFYEDMLDRMESMKRCADYEPGRNYRALGFQARFMIFDEYVAYLSMLQKKEAEEVISYLQKIVLLGRQAGFFVILSCQRPDAKYLPDGVRDQFGLRIALGAMTDSGYTMMFGTTEKQFITKRHQRTWLCRALGWRNNRVLRAICAVGSSFQREYRRCLRRGARGRNVRQAFPGERGEVQALPRARSETKRSEGRAKRKLGSGEQGKSGRRRSRLPRDPRHVTRGYTFHTRCVTKAENMRV